MKPNTPIKLLALASILALNTACAETEGEAVEKVEAKATEAKAVEAESPSKTASFQFSDAMRIPVDGTSLEAFEKSLEKIKEKATEAEYTTLINAIGYLEVYDLSARRNKTKLAANLNGLTGEEIVAKVGWKND